MKVLHVFLFVIGILGGLFGSLYFILGAFGDSPTHMTSGVILLAVSVYAFNYIYNRHN